MNRTIRENRILKFVRNNIESESDYLKQQKKELGINFFYSGLNYKILDILDELEELDESEELSIAEMCISEIENLIINNKFFIRTKDYDMSESQQKEENLEEIDETNFVKFYNDFKSPRNNKYLPHHIGLMSILEPNNCVEMYDFMNFDFSYLVLDKFYEFNKELKECVEQTDVYMNRRFELILLDTYIYTFLNEDCSWENIKFAVEDYFSFEHS
jgi:hypothetical protein